MKKFVIASLLMLALGMNSSSVYAQSVTRSGNTFTTTKVVKAKAEPMKTKYTWRDSKGIEYPIYVGSTGSCFISKISKKTGKEYRQYLGAEVSQQVCRELGIEYKPKGK